VKGYVRLEQLEWFATGHARDIVVELVRFKPPS